MRKSWKAIADVLVASMSRDDMQKVYDENRALIDDLRAHDSEKTTAIDVTNYLEMCIKEFDAHFNDN